MLSLYVISWKLMNWGQALHQSSHKCCSLPVLLVSFQVNDQVKASNKNTMPTMAVERIISPCYLWAAYLHSMESDNPSFISVPLAILHINNIHVTITFPNATVFNVKLLHFREKRSFRWQNVLFQLLWKSTLLTCTLVGHWLQLFMEHPVDPELWTFRERGVVCLFLSLSWDSCFLGLLQQTTRN